jgi:hypothetical protein
MSFSFMIYLFLISILESVSKIFVICTLYFATYWNMLIVLLCASNYASILCINHGVWNLGISLLKLILEDPRLLCAVQISPITFVHVAKLDFEGNIPSLFYGSGIDCCTFSGPRSKLYIYSSIGYWAWDSNSLLGHL